MLGNLGTQNQGTGLGAAAMTGLNVPGQAPAPLGGGLAAPVRSPIGQTRPMTALGAAAAQQDGQGASLGARPLGQAPLAPARAPIGSSAAPLGAPQAGTPGFLGAQPEIEPFTPTELESEPTIEESAEEVDDEVEQRPPGGGRMIKSGGPSVKAPPVKGPPGGGRMIRQPASTTVKGPPVRKTIEPETETVSDDAENIAELVPASDRRLLTPVSDSQTASIKPVKTLQPTSEEKSASIRPVKVMKPVSSEEE